LRSNDRSLGFSNGALRVRRRSLHRVHAGFIDQGLSVLAGVGQRHVDVAGDVRILLVLLPNKCFLLAMTKYVIIYILLLFLKLMSIEYNIVV
jgi:hypothetical protein